MPRISWRSRSSRVQLMNRKQMTAPIARATSISSRQRRRTSSFGNRSTRNSIESMMIRLGFSARTAVMMVSLLPLAGFEDHDRGEQEKHCRGHVEQQEPRRELAFERRQPEVE